MPRPPSHSEYTIVFRERDDRVGRTRFFATDIGDAVRRALIMRRHTPLPDLGFPECANMLRCDLSWTLEGPDGFAHAGRDPRLKE